MKEEADIQLFSVLDEELGVGDDAADEWIRRGWPHWFIRVLALPYSTPIRSGLAKSHGEALVTHALIAWICTLKLPPIGALYPLATIDCTSLVGRQDRRSRKLLSR
ncbi:MAG: hypothetical protein ACJAYU_004536 [Bradymonadia bacterium]|jgi:hypothetical protein